ncbi:mPR-like GPCR protein [Lasiosphaeria miniovina]|uniref:MPR-like GPCR protein n=1 Tax=Lasiosphaeria miniovina TaxID=1954250 RepID=A0AA40DHN6_9PEZI|nr:mPR-like GPCR protein [Lasiosphaeria miniovina]KAK0703505.1 mPR-like GPCR protein [Lasiosphaeria miniovina]
MPSAHRRVSPPQPPEVRKELPAGNGCIHQRFSRNKSKARKARPVLLSFDELPEWHQDNEYIRHGYRPISGSAQVSFCSWSYLHNESVNIYSHLIPGIALLLGEWYIQQYLASRYSRITATDHVIFTFFLLTAVICLGLSTTYHTLMNHSKKVEQLCLQLDLVGIVVLTLGDFVSGIYVIFWCEPLQRKIYWSMIGVLGALTIVIMINPKLQGRKFRVFRTLTFVALGASGFAPLIHGITIFGWSQMVKQSGLPYYLAEGGFLLTGSFLYATKFPESRYPGKFDVWGSSHQLFHIMVVLATVSQLVGILEAFDYNYFHRKCSSL